MADSRSVERDRHGKVISGDVCSETRALSEEQKLPSTVRRLPFPGIFGNSKQEAMYPVYANDTAGKKLDGRNCYTVHLPPDHLPPVHAFWSLTMYDVPASPRCQPINRFINSHKLPIVRGDPTAATFYVRE